MSIFQWIFTAYVIIGLLYWLMQLLLMVRAIRSMPVLLKTNPPEPAEWPKVSVILPGRNEADKIEAALRSRMSDNYPNLELIMVEDRSTDSTPQIVDRLAAENPKLKVVHIKELPQGWIGKLYAMHSGVKAATGDWLLFSDADVHVSKGAMKKVIAYAESKGLDHFGVFPDLWQVKNFFVNILMCNFVRIILLAARVWEVEDPTKETGMGVGAFNLVRRSAFLKTPGFEWLKMEVADDAAFGYMMKKSGAKCAVANGTGLTGLHYLKSIREALVSAERAGFTNIGNFSLIRLLTMGVILFLLDWSPFIAIVPAGVPYLQFTGIAMLILSIITHIIGNKSTRRPLYEAFLWFLATPLNAYAFIRAGVLGKLRGGIYWKGTFYPTEELKKGKRYNL
jgi:glycosyltransferase involved in cell wall biosynthesis